MSLNRIDNNIVSTDFKATAIAGRVTTLDFDNDTVTGVEILQCPAYGNITVNPDNTFAVVLSGTTQTDDLSFNVRITYMNGDMANETINVEIETDNLQNGGWGGGDHYMLQTDDNDDVVVEHGESHRVVHVSGNKNALTLDDIAILEGMDVSDVTGRFLMDNPEYGENEDMALAEDAGEALWLGLIVNGPRLSSNWLLLERGYEYDEINVVRTSMQGESEINPIYVGAYGEGAAPKVSTAPRLIKEGVDNVLIQDIEFDSGFMALAGSNILIDNVTFRDDELNIQNIDGFTLRNSTILDATDDEPTWPDIWEAFGDRESGIFISGSDGILFEGNLFDHNGWAEGYDYNNSADSPMPPSMLNHNVYMAHNNLDTTFTDNIVMQGASTGIQLRSGGFVQDNVFIDNNIAVTIGFGTGEFTGNYTLLNDNVVTSAGYHDVADRPGNLAGGIDVQGFHATFIDTIIAHLADPNNPDELAEKVAAGNPMEQWNPLTKSWPKPVYNDTIIYNWVGAGNYDKFDEKNKRIDGLDEMVLNETTIQNFTADLLGQDTATISDLADFLRAQHAGGFADVVDADLIIDFFQTGFGVSTTLRDEEDTLRFIPNALGDGIRWDNRLNWDTQDLPGTQDGDSVDLGGNWVIYGGTNSIEDLTFGAGGELEVSKGYLEVEGLIFADDDGAELNIDNAGQFWTNGYTDHDMLDINIDGGRFANTGLFTGTTDLTASGNAQVILASDGADFVVNEGSQLTIIGGDTKVGFDGDQGDTGVLLLAEGATLSFEVEDGEIGQIREFYSGHFDDNAAGIQSGINFGNATLNLDVTGLSSTDGWLLMTADEIIGTFADFNVTGLGAQQDVSIIIDYDLDEVILNLGEDGEGSGSQAIYTQGDANNAQSNSDLWDALNIQVISSDKVAPIGQSGTFTLVQNNSEQWHTVTFDSAITNAVVVMGPITFNGTNPGTTRVRNVTDTGFEFQIDEWNYLDGYHIQENIGWLAISEGSHTLASGQKIVAGAQSIGTNFTNVDFGEVLGEAVVLAEITTVNETDAATTRIRQVNDMGFQVKVQEEEALGVHADETVSWIAIQTGTSSQLDVVRTDDQLNHQSDSFMFNAAFDAAPVLLADMQSTDGSDTATVRMNMLNQNGVSLFIEEETSADTERSHTNETAGYVAMTEGLIFDEFAFI